jgi:hypothetical protein
MKKQKDISPQDDLVVIPIQRSTRIRIKNKMKKKDTYDSYIIEKLNRLEELEKKLKMLNE